MLISGIISGIGSPRVVRVAPATIVTYTTVSGTFVQSPNNVWGNSGFGLSSLSLPASTDGTYQCDYTSTANLDAAIAFDPVNTNTNQTTYDYSIYVDSGTTQYAIIENGTPLAASGITAVSGHKFRLRRTGSTFFAEYSANAVTWTLIYTFGTTSSAQQFLKAFCSSTSVLNPQATNVT